MPFREIPQYFIKSSQVHFVLSNPNVFLPQKAEDKMHAPFGGKSVLQNIFFVSPRKRKEEKEREEMAVSVCNFNLILFLVYKRGSRQTFKLEKSKLNLILVRAFPFNSLLCMHKVGTRNLYRIICIKMCQK